MTIEHGWINIYRSGWFHRAGKPGGFDRHGGDLYPTKEAAEADIEPQSHFIATVEVRWPEVEKIAPNGPQSLPRPLRDTRREAEEQQRVPELAFD